MSENRKKKLLKYHQEKAKGLEIIRQNAQSAFVRAQEEKKNGNIEKAIQWMDRAHRLAESNPNITFDLVMLHIQQHNYENALALSNSLMQQFDFYEGWIAQSLILSCLDKPKQVIDKIGYALSQFCIALETWPLVQKLVTQSVGIGCCGVLLSNNYLYISSRSKQKISVFLDDDHYLDTTRGELLLPEGWQTKGKIRVEKHGVPLVGSPIDVKAICRTQGFVEVDQQDIKGWLWYPTDPNNIPKLRVYDSHHQEVISLDVVDEFKVATLDVPLFRGKCFSFSISDFKEGLISFKDEYGHHLIGSPLNPYLFKNQKRKFKTIEEKHQHYVPVSAYLKSEKPNFDMLVTREAAIIIPVYKGYQDTINCFLSVLNTLSQQFIIQIVNDASPDHQLIDELEKYVDHKNVFMIHHDENKGFSEAVNTGIQAWPDHDVILLNSDTLVASGWAEGLHQAAYQDQNIATVTPFSNDASIFSYPYHDEANPVPSLQQVEQFMQIADDLHAPDVIDVPTANGFCMYIRRDCLNQIGYFRGDLFAQGYGEENDFCMRAQHLGWRHVLAPHVFVGHKGSVSFQNNKKSLMARNMKILNHLYPGYDEMVMDYIQNDDLLPIRRQFDFDRIENVIHEMGLLEEKPHFVLLVSHNYGGGVERALQERINNYRLKHIIPMILRPTLIGDGCQLEIEFRSLTTRQKNIEWVFPNLTFYLPEDYTLFIKYLQKFQIDLIEIHHFLGHHKIIHSLLDDLKIPYDMYLHDYMCFCPRITLINHKKQYCFDQYNPDICQICMDSKKIAEGDEVVNIREWIQRSAKELTKARSVIVPSQNTEKYIRTVFPQLNNLSVSPLEDDRLELSLSQLSFFSGMNNKSNKQKKPKIVDRFKICIIGAIGVEKGFNIVKSLVKDADERNLPIEFILVGRTVDDRIFSKTDRIFITGSYKEEEGISLVMEQDADLAFFPAIWPETWSYALSVAWRAGLEVVAYDLGAIAERIQKTKRGYLLPRKLSIQKINNKLIEICMEKRYKNNNT